MIPPRNIYYMLLYAWGHYNEGEVSLVGDDESPDLPTLLARVLNSHTHRLLRSGLDRGYIGLVEEGRAIRGRLRLGDIAKRQTVRLRGTAVYEFDELTPDVLHNRIVFETLIRLSRSSRIDKDVRHQVGLTAKRFRDVSRVHFTSSLFSRVMLSRNTAQYRLLMDICALLFQELMPDTVAGSSRFKTLAEDKVRMPALFEEFLRSFYRMELPQFQVGAKEYHWSTERQGKGEDNFLPKMKTDVTIRFPETVLTIEAKFNRKVLVPSQHGGEKVRSGHLYQLSSYLAHAAGADPARHHTGLLLYAQREKPLDFCIRLLGQPTRIATVNLGAEWQVIHQRLLSLANEGRAEARQPNS